VVQAWFRDLDGHVIALIKPQFEAGRKAAAIHAGVIKDPEVHNEVLENILHGAKALGYLPVGLIASPIQGPKGNVEFLVDLRLAGDEGVIILDQMIKGAIEMIPD
jgi:23S rRNA (cytidine1920-2'-O)/16S rRNA (cytidine1409-2'-O)-methyltransferase